MKRKTKITLCAFILMGLIFVPKNFIKAETTVVNVTDVEELCSSHDYENNTDKTWVYSVKGAAELLVKFSEDTKLEVGGADYIYIYDKNDEEIGKYGGTKLSGKTIAVPYDTVKIRLVSDTSNTAYGFAVDSVVSMDSISVKTQPERTNYLVEQQPDYTGLVVQGNYSDGTSKEVIDGYTFSEVDNKTEGTQKVTVNYHGLTADFNIEYKNPKIVKLDVTTTPKKTKYNYLEELDITDMVLTATDQDDNTYLVKDKFEVTGYSSATVGKQTLTVNYADVSTTFEVEVVYPFTYTTSGNNVTITGISDANLTQLVIPEEIGGKTVTSIKASAFKDNTKITLANLPDTVTSIGSYAFSGCTKLGSVNIPSKITELADYSFKDCGLTKITLPDGLIKIGDGVFSGCSKLASVILPNKVEGIGGSAFSGCKSITEVKFPTTLKTLGSYAYENTGLTEVEVPDTVTKIGCGCFEGAPLVSIKLPYVGNTKDAVEEKAVLGYVFGYTTSYKTGTTDQYYKPGKSYDYYIPSTLKSVEVTDAIQIPYGAFYNCSNLTSVKLNEGVTSIGEKAFYNCTGLTDMELSEAITGIGEYAFSGCTKLSSVNIPSKITKLSNYVFQNCALVKATLPEGLTMIGNCAFSGCSKLASVILPNKIESIGGSAFSGCKSITEVKFPTTLKTLGSCAYANTELTDVEVPDTVTQIGYGCFEGAPLVSIKLPYVGNTKDAVEENAVLGYVFGYTTGYETGTTNQYYDSKRKCYYSYYIPSTLKSVEITNAVTIPYHAFYNCSNLTSVKLNEGITSIGNEAFYNCTGLADMELPNSVTSIGGYAFLGCKNLILHDSKGTVVGDYAQKNNITLYSTKEFSLDKESMLLHKGDTAKLNATVVMLNDQPDPEPNITWKSSNEDVVTVQDGTITVTGPGKAKITATIDDKQAECDVEVAYLLEDIIVEPEEISLYEGKEEKINVSYEPENTTDDKTITWTSSNEEVATVDENGIVHAINKGSAIITVQSSKENIKKTVKVTVLRAVTDITFDQKVYVIGKDETLELNPTIMPEGYTDQLTWSSKDESVATVDATGKVTAINVGTTVINVTADSGVTVDGSVKVVVKADSISFSEEEIQISQGRTKKLNSAFLDFPLLGCIISGYEEGHREHRYDELFQSKCNVEYLLCSRTNIDSSSWKTVDALNALRDVFGYD